jgi:WD40 repeat protein
MSAPLSRPWASRLAALSLLLGLAGVAVADDKTEGWDVQLDPTPAPIKGPFDTKTSLPVAFMGRTVYSTQPSPFVALTPAKTKDTLQVYDLRTMKEVGKPIQAKLDHDGLTLSPDGAYLAGRVRGQQPAVEVWSVAEGKSLRTIPLAEKGPLNVPLLEFVGKGKLITEKDWNSEPVYQVWDVESGKEDLTFSYTLEFHPKWGGVSPGGRYLVMEQTGTLIGYHLVAFDLKAGKKVGDFEFQGKKDQWGQACGLSFSPDGTELAMVWRLKNKDCWGRIWVWDVKTGKQLFNHAIGNELKWMDSLWFNGGVRTFQWTPDGSGWLLFGHLLIDHDTGAVVGKLGPEPNSLGPMERRFLDKDHLTLESREGFDWKVAVEELPREQIDAAVKKAREKSKEKNP